MNNKPQNLTLEEINNQMVVTLRPAVILVGILMVVGLLGNGLVFYVFCRKMPRGAHNFLIVCLAVFDLVSCAVGMPAEIVDLKELYMFQSKTACRVFRFVNVFTAISSIFALLVIAVDRYKNVLRPFHPQMTTKSAHYSLIFILIGSLLLSWPALVLYGIRSVDMGIPKIHGRDCSTDHDFQGTVFPLVYNIVQFVGFAVISTLLAVVYIRIFREIRRHFKYLRSTTDFYRTPRFSANAQCNNRFSLVSDSNTHRNDRFLIKRNEHQIRSNPSQVLQEDTGKVSSNNALKLDDMLQQEQLIYFSASSANLSHGNTAKVIETSKTDTHLIPYDRSTIIQTSKTDTKTALVDTSMIALTSKTDTKTVFADTSVVTVTSKTDVRSALEDTCNIVQTSKPDELLMPKNTLRNITRESLLNDIRFSEINNLSKENDVHSPPSIEVTKKYDWLQLSTEHIPTRASSERRAGTGLHFSEKESATDSLFLYRQENMFSRLSGDENLTSVLDPKTAASCTHCSKQLPRETARSNGSCESVHVSAFVSTVLISTDATNSANSNRSVRMPTDTTIFVNSHKSVQQAKEATTVVNAHRSVQLPIVTATFDNSNRSAQLPTDATTTDSDKSGRLVTCQCHVVLNHTQSNNQNQTSQPSSVSTKNAITREAKPATKVAVAVTTVFIASFLPHLCLMLARYLNPNLYRELSESEYVSYSIFLRSYLANSVLNPFVYGWLNKKFRHHCYQIVHKAVSCCH